MGFKRLNFSLKVLIKTGSFMRVSTVTKLIKLLALTKGLGPTDPLSTWNLPF